MIYKDKLAYLDTEKCPKARGNEKCLNCGYSIYDHFNWACEYIHANMKFFELPGDKRYLTQSMRDSIPSLLMAAVGNSATEAKIAQDISINKITPDDFLGYPKTIPTPPKEKDISDWRTWAHNRPGDCPCGIARVDCKYHNV